MQKKIEFKELGLDPKLLSTLEKSGFVAATSIQEMTIGPILSGKDIFAQAETGSGKTASFSIPILEKICRDDLVERDKNSDVLYVVLSPTRELAQQTYKVFSSQGEDLNIVSTCLIGGENIDAQKKLLKESPHILVATPGRLVDLIRQRSVSIKKCLGVVFDEADRLFDMGFKKDIEFILRQVPVNRQLIMVSATSNFEVLNTAYKFHSSPIEINVSKDGLLVDNLDHKIAMLSSNEKFGLLVNTIRKHEDGYALVFCNTQFQTHLVAEWLADMGFKAKAISGRLPQNRRTALMKQFRSKSVTILVCTDVAARGLDIKDVNLVINYDIPQEAVNYVHRIGRTGREGKNGEAISFCTHEDCEFLDEIYTLIECKIPKLELTKEDFATDLCRRPFIDRRTLKVTSRHGGPMTKTKHSKDHHSGRREKIINKKLHEVTSVKVKKQVKVKEQNKKIKPVKQIIVPEKTFYTAKAYSFEKATNSALDFFKIKNKSELVLENTSKGRKRFLFFGGRITNYKYSVRPSYKKIIVPFLTNILELANLDLSLNYTYERKNISVFLLGKDEKMLTRNYNELLGSLEYLTSVHLYRAAALPSDVRFSLKCKGYKDHKDSLIQMIDRMTKKVVETKNAITLKPLNSADRRLVHQHLDKHAQVKTLSLGEGRMKRIKICLTK